MASARTRRPGRHHAPRIANVSPTRGAIAVSTEGGLIQSGRLERPGSREAASECGSGLEPLCGARLTREPQTRTSADRRYGVMGCGGITEMHWLGGVRFGLAGTCVGSPGARVSSAAREQFPPGMFHQLDVIGYAAV